MEFLAVLDIGVFREEDCPRPVAKLELEAQFLTLAKLQEGLLRPDLTMTTLCGR